jgi:hypothetical protein
MEMKKYKLLPFAFCLLFWGCNTIEKTEITGLRCEYRANPLGIETPHPRFSWLITSGERGIYQQAYRIVVSDNPEEVKKKNGSHWDSGFVISGNTGHIAYEGLPLISDHTYYWRICSQINGKETWSNPAEFRTGMLNPDDWKAQWISTPEPITLESPLFRHSFSIDKTVKEAYVYAAAAGFYELYLNGEKVGGDVLNPSVTDYRQTVLYSVYELTKYLKKGVNVFGLMLGNGAYNMLQAPDRYTWDSNSFGNPRFLLQLNIKYLDGSETTVTSGEEWKYTGGPITFNNLYGGEDYDARKEIESWAAAGPDDSDWKKASLAEPPGGKPKYQDIPIRITQTLLPVAKTQPRKGVYLFDLGQNIAGWWRITLKGVAGQTIRVRGSETLNNDLFPKNMEDNDKISDKFSYHSKTWTDYTLKNNEKAVYEPHFFYSGFRYIEVVVSDSIPFKALSDTIRDELNRKFFNPETALYGSDSTYQTYQLLALAGNITPETHRIPVLKTITDDIKERNNHLNTGIIGTKYLWQVLPEAGCNDLAYALATQEMYPSYGYWIRNNCTTFLEKWDGADSHNHQMFGTITEYLYRYLAGIRSPASGKTSLAYKHIHLQPYMPDSLHEVNAKLNTLSGEIISHWKKQSGGYQYNVTIPANTTATVILPLEESRQATITESGKTIWKNKAFPGGVTGVKNLERAGEQINLLIESGTYHFQVVYDDNIIK